VIRDITLTSRQLINVRDVTLDTITMREDKLIASHVTEVITATQSVLPNVRNVKPGNIARKRQRLVTAGNVPRGPTTQTLDKLWWTLAYLAKLGNTKTR